MTRVFHPILGWAIGGACIGAGIAATATFLHMWLADLSVALGIIQHNAGLGALVGVHLGLLIAYLRSYQDEVPATWEVSRREPIGILLGVLLLVYAICWIAISS
ncbi:MAG: hypothetical protein HGA65_02080 [Oscillochloris sp.]|nr:hypothetical protein [Oscillochloris sp.]